MLPNLTYVSIVASTSIAAIGSSGAAGVGSILERVIIVPETLGAGTVSISDDTGTAINLLVTGTLQDLKPIVVELGMISKVGGWKLATGSNVHAIAVGRFIGNNN